MATPERMGMGWPLWVFGWALLVGGVLFVLPAYLVLGVEAALWSGGVVGGISLLLTWLAGEAGRALNADAEGGAEPALTDQVVSRET